MRTPRFLSAVVLGGSLLACNKSYPNPFTSQGMTEVPGASDDLLFVSDGWGTAPSGLGELYSASSSTGHVARLTSCNAAAACNTLAVAPAPDRKRVAVMRVVTDTNGDGRLTEADGAALVYVDLTRGVEAALVPPTGRVAGADWSPQDGLIVYSGPASPGALEDLFRVDTNGQNPSNLTNTPTVRELRPRIDPTGSVAVFERIDTGGKAAIWLFESSVASLPVDTGGPGTDPLPGTPFVVGADADPAFSPDGTAVVFRRLTGTGNNGLGTWDILRTKADGSTPPTPLATGPVYRGAPDWGPKGIVFAETDAGKGTSTLVVLQPDGTGRTTPVTFTSGFTLDAPRWLAPAP